MFAEFGVQFSILAAATMPSGIQSYPIIQQLTPKLVCWNQDKTRDPDSSAWYIREEGLNQLKWQYQWRKRNCHCLKNMPMLLFNDKECCWEQFIRFFFYFGHIVQIMQAGGEIWLKLTKESACLTMAHHSGVSCCHSSVQKDEGLWGRSRCGCLISLNILRSSGA